jgi:hypothetical protein
MIDMAAVQLGKRAGVVEDPRHFMLADLLVPGELPPLPDRWRIAEKLRSWPMFRNDELGDCTAASLAGHRIAAQEWSSGRRDKLPVTDADVVGFYASYSGFIEGRPETDQGAYLVDALKAAQHRGIGREADGTPHTIGAYARVSEPGSTLFRRAAHLFGGLYLGLALPVTASRQDVWKLTPQDRWGAEDQPYSWGGHAVWMVGYDPQGVTLVTWGMEQRATWDWMRFYCDEAWALISEDFINRLGRTPQGLDVVALQRMLGTLR